MNMPLRVIALSSWMVLAACGGGGSDAVAARTEPVPGSVHVVVDTRTGRDGVVQFQVEAAVLERVDGSVTANVLREPRILTLADPIGEPMGLSLRGVPTGVYDALHLVLVPGSGSVQFRDGTRVPVTGPLDLEIPIADSLEHDAAGATWLAVGHNDAQSLQEDGGVFAFTPEMTGRLDGSQHSLYEIEPLVQDGGMLVATWPNAHDGVLWLAFADDCVFQDAADGTLLSRAQFDALLGAAEVRVDGELHRDGRCVAQFARVARRNPQPRLIGPIVELRPESERFVMEVVSQTLRGNREPVITETFVTVITADARLHRQRCGESFAFGQLAVGDTVKVKVRSSEVTAAGETLVYASEIEVPGGTGAPPCVEWQGRVADVELVSRNIRVEPRHGEGHGHGHAHHTHTIRVGGVEVPFVDVAVPEGLRIQRRERHGPGRAEIGLEGVVVGDRIWWRGEVSGPQSIAASWIRLRGD